MGRVIIAGVLGAVVVFMWGWLSWDTLKLHDRSFAQVSSDTELAPLLGRTLGKTGVYWFPAKPDKTAQMTDAQQEEAWMQKRQAGPVGMVFYRAEGDPTTMTMFFARGFGIVLVASLVMATILGISGTQSFMRRFAMALLMALFAAISIQAVNWNWLSVPTNFTLAAVTDEIIGWGVAGLLIAMIVKPAPEVPLVV